MHCVTTETVACQMQHDEYEQQDKSNGPKYLDPARRGWG